MRLRLAEHLLFPVDVATQSILITGKRNSGKSSTGTRLAEQLIGIGVPVSVLDPVDVWWGLKAGANGTREGGLPVYVFGGQRAPDLPLQPTAGRLMADLFIDERVNMILCTRGFTEGEKHRFVSDYADQLFSRNRRPVHVFCEEAHNYMPQTLWAPRGKEGVQENLMLNRMVRLWKEGRTSGIGLTAISQRVGSVNKNVTTQAEILIVHRLLAEQDVDAIDGWIKHHRQQEKRREVLAALAELKTGEAFVWAPDFPEDKPIGLRRLFFLMPETFDSRRTPKVGERLRKPKSLAPVDLKRLETKMAATIEQVKANDPKELRSQLIAANRQIAELKARKPAPAKPMKPGRPFVSDRQVERLVKAAAMFRGVCDIRPGMRQLLNEYLADDGPMAKAERRFRAAWESIEKVLPGATTGRFGHRPVLQHAPEGMEMKHTPEGVEMHIRANDPSALRETIVRHVPEIARKTAIAALSDGPVRLREGERRILAVIAARHPTPVTRAQAGTLAGYPAGGETFRTYVGVLKRKGLIERTSDPLQVTPLGLAVAGTVSVQSSEEVLAMWRRRLRAGEKKILDHLVSVYPRWVTKDALASVVQRNGDIDGALVHAAFSPETFRTYIGVLKRNRLVEEEQGSLKASDSLFPGTVR